MFSCLARAVVDEKGFKERRGNGWRKQRRQERKAWKKLSQKHSEHRKRKKDYENMEEGRPTKKETKRGPGTCVPQPEYRMGIQVSGEG